VVGDRPPMALTKSARAFRTSGDGESGIRISPSRVHQARDYSFRRMATRISSKQFLTRQIVIRSTSSIVILSPVQSAEAYRASLAGYGSLQRGLVRFRFHAQARRARPAVA
jgi:hypothetical protein